MNSDPHDDMGLSLVKQHERDLSRQLAETLDDVIGQYVQSIENRPINLSQDVPGEIGPTELARHGFKVEMRCGEADPDTGWYNFFIWKRAQFGHVLAWRITTGSHFNEANHAMMMECTLQSLVIARDQWPEGLRRFLEEGA